MRKLILLVGCLVLLSSPAWAAGSFISVDCANDPRPGISTPTANDTFCLQSTTTGGIKESYVVVWDGSAWVFHSGPCTKETRDPDSGDDTTSGYMVGSCWVNTAGNTDWVAVKVTGGAAIWSTGGGGTDDQTLDEVVVQGRTTDKLNSKLNSLQLGNTDIKWNIYCTGTNECFIETDPASNSRQRIQTDKTGGFYDVEGASDIFTIDPDAASVNAMYSFAAAYRPLNSALLSMSSDGTQCASPAEITVGSWGKMWTTICTDNDASVMTGTISSMPNKWDGGTIKVTMSVVQDAADTGALHADVSARCVAKGAAPAAYGTEVALDIAAVTGSDALNGVTSAAVTPSGTCAGGNLLQFQIAVDAVGTTTAMATLHLLDPKVEYSVSSLSD